MLVQVCLRRSLRMATGELGVLCGPGMALVVNVDVADGELREHHGRAGLVEVWYPIHEVPDGVWFLKIVQ